MNGIKAVVDGLRSDEWTRYLLGFEDANLYQTHSYGSIRWGSENLSRLIMYRNESPVAMAQLRIAKIPVVGKGIAYLRWGPVWVTKEGPTDPEVVTSTLRALKEEYSNRRGLLLRILPTNRGLDPGSMRQLCADEGFEVHPPNYQTLLVDLRPSLEEIRMNLDPKWRTQLNQCGRNSVAFRIGTDRESFDHLIATYDQMVDLKGFSDSVDIHEHQRIQEDLPETCKMRVALAMHEGRPVASLLFWAFGDCGLAIMGGSNELGRRSKAGFGLHWEVIRYLKEAGCESYDLGGVSRERNPGGYLFKKGLAGKNAEEISYPGQFDFSKSALLSHVVGVIENASERVRKLRVRSNDPNGNGKRNEAEEKKAVAHAHGRNSETPEGEREDPPH